MGNAIRWILQSMKRRLWRHCEDGVTVSPPPWRWCWCWMKPLNPKYCPGPTLGPQLALWTHIFHPLADTGAGPGWAGPMVVLTCDQLRYPETALVTHQWHCNTVIWDRMVKMPPAIFTSARHLSCFTFERVGAALVWVLPAVLISTAEMLIAF